MVHCREDWRVKDQSDPKERQMENTTYALRPLLAEIRDGFRGLRAAHAARKSLERELASYTSAADLNDLGAILDRYSEEETADIRRILAARRV
jgi:hypothetical protein